MRDQGSGEEKSMAAKRRHEQIVRGIFYSYLYLIILDTALSLFKDYSDNLRGLWATRWSISHVISLHERVIYP